MAGSQHGEKQQRGAKTRPETRGKNRIKVGVSAREDVHTQCPEVEGGLLGFLVGEGGVQTRLGLKRIYMADWVRM
nr:hypothetical protein Iba_chr09aCG15810 [Ipomoea batatas]GMD36256.1 hypothetical protein Iba_chr09dCG14720 [Ipomoea batatas]